jgi:hypothetical protein
MDSVLSPSQTGYRAFNRQLSPKNAQKNGQRVGSKWVEMVEMGSKWGRSTLAPLRKRENNLGQAVPIRYCRSAASIAFVTSLDSGSTAESKRAAIFPFRSTTNFVKFQPISPPVAGFAFLSVRNWYSGA